MLEEAVTTLTTPEQTLRSVDSLVPLMQQQRRQADEDCWIGDEVSEKLNDADIYRLLAPKRYGGLEYNLQDTLTILTRIAEGSASAAWVAGIHNAAIWIAGLCSVACQEEVFSGDKPTVVSGTLAPMGRLTTVDGGYRLTGRWNFGSGVLDATWILLGCPRIDGDEGDLFALAPMSDVTIHKNWDVMGLAATGSHGVAANDIFIPEYRFFDPLAGAAGNYPSEYAKDVPLFRSAFLPVISAVLVCPALGAAKTMLATFLDQVPRKSVTYTIYTKQAESVITQSRLAEAALLIDEAQFHQDRLAKDIDEWAAGTEYMPHELRVRNRADIGRALDLCREAANLIFSLGGGAGLALGNPLQGLFRDIHAANSHPLQMATVQYEIYGRMLLGQPQITPLI